MTDPDARTQLRALLTAHLDALIALRRRHAPWTPTDFTVIIGVVQALWGALRQITPEEDR